MERFFLRIRFDGALHVASTSTPERCAGCDVFWRGYVSSHDAVVNTAPESPRATDILARAYRRFGADFSRHVEGAFAAVVVDSARATVILAHDELGLETLFYALCGDGLIVATDLLDLIGATGIGELDDEYLSDYLAHGWHFGERTPYSHVRRVRIGECLVWRAGNLKRVKTWTLDSVAPLVLRDERDYEAQLRELLREAVARAMPPGRVWCELSGGLDSTTVLATAATIGNNPVSACSFIYPRSTTADEQPWITAAVEKYQVHWHPFDGDALRPFSTLPDTPQGEPNLSLINAASQGAYSGHLRMHNASVVLTGEGGDATFCGDAPAPFYLADMLRSLRFGDLRDAANALSHGCSKGRAATYFLWRYAAVPAALHARRRPTESDLLPSPWIEPEFARRTNVIRRGQRSWAPRTSSVATSAVLEQVIRCARLAASFYEGGRGGAQFRHPLLDRRLVAFMCSVPWRVKLHPACDRLLQRRALETILPRKVVMRKNKVSPGEAHYAGLAQGDKWLDWLADKPRIVERGYVDAEAWHSALAPARLANTNGIRHFEAAASLEAWLRLLETAVICRPAAPIDV